MSLDRGRQESAERGDSSSDGVIAEPLGTGDTARIILNACPIAAMLIDTDGVILDLNQAMAQSLGGEVSTLQGAKGRDLVSPEDFERRWAHIAEAVECGVPQVFADQRNGRSFITTVHPIVGNSDEVTSVVIFAEDTTEHERAAIALQESDEKFRALVENLSIGVYRSTPDHPGTLIYANPAMARMLGYQSSEETIEITPAALYQSVEDRERLIEDLSRHGVVRNREICLRRRDGHPLWAMCTATAHISETGEFNWIDGVVEDISLRKWAQEMLHESEERYRTLFGQASDAIVLIDATTGDLVDFNDRALAHLDYTREEFAQLRMTDIEASESAEEIAAHVEAVIRDGADNFETKHRTKSGELRDVQVSARALELQGKMHIHATWRDITERNQMLQILRSNEETARGLLDSCPLIAAMFDTRGTFLAINGAMERSLGLSADEVVGRSMRDLFSPDVADRRLSHLREAAKRAAPVAFEDVRDGRTFRSLYGPVRNEQGYVLQVAMFAEDITERRRNEHLAALGTTASNLAHSIKNIQSHLMGATSVLDDAIRGHDWEKMNRAWPLLKRSSDRISRLVRDMLSMARETEVVIEPTDLNLMISEILDSCQPLAREANVTLHRNLDERLGEIPLDCDRMHDALVNLVGNAIEAIQWGGGTPGTVEVITRRSSDSGSVEILVIDNGTGIPPEIHGNLFDVFFSTKGARGSGLGLPVVKKAIGEMGGSISFESELGAGATFSVCIPLRNSQRE